MRMGALSLIAAGVLLTAGSALAPWSLDFAVSVRPGWHMTVFPSTFIGVLVIMSGVVALLASLVWRSVSSDNRRGWGWVGMTRAGQRAGAAVQAKLLASSVLPSP